MTSGSSYEAAIAGQGMVLASWFFVEEDIRTGRLVRLFAGDMRAGADFYAVSPRKPRHAASVAAVRAWLATTGGQAFRSPRFR